MTGVVVWITGLPSSGKSTFAKALRSKLKKTGAPVCVLDSDAVRKAVFPELGYGSDDRDVFYAALGRLAGLLARQGFVVIVAATAHLRKYRERAQEIAPAFVEVYISTDIEECKRRDAKGLYARAAAGKLTGVPGLQAVFEEPVNPDVVADDGRSGQAVEATVSRVLKRLEEDGASP